MDKGRLLCLQLYMLREVPAVTVADSRSLSRTAQFLVVESRRGSGSPPSFGAQWDTLYAAKVDRTEINAGDRPSQAVVLFPALRWDETLELYQGDMIRIRTDEPKSSDRTIIFSGFVASYLSDFSGGTEKHNAFERNGVVAKDYRWLLARTSTLFGQIARGPDDYTDYGTPSQAPIDNSSTYLSGRRAIFNRSGKPNRDPVHLTVEDSAGNTLCETPIFASPSTAVPWTARDMIRHLLSPLWNKAYKYIPIPDPNTLAGLDHSDFDKVINHIVVDSLNIIESVALVCSHLGWSLREDYANDGSVNLVFYKSAAASSYTRNTANPTIRHWLHAPAPAETISAAVAQGLKMLWSMSLIEDIDPVVNKAWGLGAPHRFEITTELVPAWLDTDFLPDTEFLYFTEFQLQDESSPDNYAFYKYYHARGSSFKRDVGRKWTLNESGRYSSSTTYDRGMPFDFSTVIPAEYILDADGSRRYAPFDRGLLPCLTFDKDTLNSVGIKVEFSFDSGATWQTIPAAISALPSEAGIYIDDPNLAELVDKAEAAISGGSLDGEQLNFFTSLADDKLNSRVFKDGDWHTRVRITASIQMDQRLYGVSNPSASSGSPFNFEKVYNFSDQYTLTERTPSSSYDGSGLAAWDTNQLAKLEAHISAIRAANEDMSLSGRFTLDRLWLGDGDGQPAFALGDSIEKITGREYKLSAALNDTEVYPEIVRIVYLPDKQKMQIITRDLRYAEKVIN